MKNKGGGNILINNYERNPRKDLTLLVYQVWTFRLFLKVI